MHTEFLKMFAGRVIKFTIAVIVLLVVCVFLFASFSPYRLDPSRMGPRKPASLPTITKTKNAKNYLLFPKHENSQFAVHISKPNEYIHPSNRTSDVIIADGFNVQMYYPDMTGTANPKNERLNSCLGWCEGKLSALIEASLPENERNKRQLARLYKDREQKNPAVVYKPLAPAYGFDEHFMFSFPMAEERLGSRGSTKEYFVKNDEDGEPQYIIDCNPYTPSPSCSTNLRLKAFPELTAWLSFGMQLLPEWQNLLDSFEKRVLQWSPVKHVMTNGH